MFRRFPPGFEGGDFKSDLRVPHSYYWQQSDHHFGISETTSNDSYAGDSLAVSSDSGALSSGTWDMSEFQSQSFSPLQSSSGIFQNTIYRLDT